MFQVRLKHFLIRQLAISGSSEQRLQSHR